MTATVLRLASASREDGDDRRQLITAMQSFFTMYRSTRRARTLSSFRRTRELVSANEYDAIAEQFEREEHSLFGKDGFEKMVDRVARIARMIGLNDLSKFTPA